jgi:AbrB family looped-hinge helix DNA binding protein
MTYTVKISNRGTITIPKELRKDMQVVTGSKILIIKRKNDYIIRAVPKVSSLKSSFKSNKKFTDEEIEKLKHKVFLRTKNIF